MRIIKRKILRETLLSRVDDVTYGTVTASTIYLPIFISQTFDDIGLMTDMPVTYTAGTIEIPTINHFNTRDKRTSVDGYYDIGDALTGQCQSRLVECENYGIIPYVPMFNVNMLDYINYEGTLIHSGTMVFNVNTTSTGTTRYTIKGDLNDPGLGTVNQRSGLFMTDTGPTTATTSVSEFIAKNEGMNESNTSLSAITKLDEYLGMVFPPEIQSDVFIERGRNVIFEPHFKLGEVESVDHLERFGNGYYNIIKNN